MHYFAMFIETVFVARTFRGNRARDGPWPRGNRKVVTLATPPASRKVLMSSSIKSLLNGLTSGGAPPRDNGMTSA